MYIYTHWKGKTSWRWQWGISLFSALLPLLKHLAFSQAHFCSQSTLSTAQHSRQRASERGTSAKQDFVLIPSFFPPHSYRRAIVDPERLGCSANVSKNMDRRGAPHTD